MLISHSRAVACVGSFLNLLEQLSVAFKDPQSLREIRKLKIIRLDRSDHREPRGHILLLHHVCISLRHLPSEAQFSRIWKILRDAETEVREVAVRIPRERPRTSDVDLLRRELRIGKRRDLRRNLLRRFPFVPRGL